MAFESIPGIKVISHISDQTFLVGDYFTVCYKGENVPRIYTWEEILAIQETRVEIIITTVDEIFKIPKANITDPVKFLRLRAILEGAVAAHPKINYSHLRRILPPKTYFKNCDTPPDSYIATGIYNEREISYSNVILLNTRMAKVFRIISVCIIILTFGICHFFVGNTLKNWTYFLPISIFSGVIIAMFAYLACAIIAKYIYTALLKIDPSLLQPITFVICQEGFSAVESCLYNATDLIKWEEAAYFIETNYVYIIFKNKKAVFWLPKRFFKKEEQLELGNFIARKLQQK